jgi:hypothetical protein
MAIDPANWIINGFGGIQFNPNFIAATPIQEPEKYWILYPNPATDQISVQNLKGQILNFELYQSNGKLVQTGMLSESISIDISNLMTGTYILHLSDANQKTRVKLLSIQ